MSYVISAFADEASSDFMEQIRICKENNIKFIEIRGVNGKNISDLTMNEVKEIKAQLDDNGLFISSIGSPFGKIGVLDEFEPHMDKFKRTIETAHLLGTKYMRIFSFYIPDHEDSDPYYNTVCEKLGRFLDNSEGIILCHENEKGIYGDNEIHCKKLYDTFSGRIKLIFDPANFIQCGVNIEEAYALLNDAIEYFHIKDCLYEGGQVVPAGHGDGKIKWLINQFHGNGKKTFLSVEPHLKVFSGYRDLQKEEELKQKYVYETNEQAFSVAVMALKEILCADSYRQTNDRERGYDEWIK